MCHYHAIVGANSMPTTLTHALTRGRAVYTSRTQVHYVYYTHPAPASASPMAQPAPSPPAGLCFAHGAAGPVASRRLLPAPATSPPRVFAGLGPIPRRCTVSHLEEQRQLLGNQCAPSLTNGRGRESGAAAPASAGTGGGCRLAQVGCKMAAHAGSRDAIIVTALL